LRSIQNFLEARPGGRRRIGGSSGFAGQAVPHRFIAAARVLHGEQAEKAATGQDLSAMRATLRPGAAWP
jgi:hypothetical protein